MRSTVSLLAGVLLIAFCYTGIASAQSIEIIAFGDSITQGFKRDSDGNIFGITSPLHGQGSWDGYEPELEADFATQTDHKAYVYNWGYQGERTDQGVNRIDLALNRAIAHFILIMEGANDLYSGISASTTRFNLEIMIEKSLEKNTKPIIATVTPNTARSDGDIIPNNYNPAIESLALEKGIELADQYEALFDNWQDYNSGDGLHLNDEGEKVMAQVWFDAILNSGLPSFITFKGWFVPEDVKLTASKHNGNFGGYPQMNEWIQANGCEGYHVCDYTEVSRWMQINGQSVFNQNCWITSPGVYKEGTANVGDCRGWRPLDNDVGTIIANSGGKVFPGRHYCYREFKVACCK